MQVWQVWLDFEGKRIDEDPPNQESNNIVHKMKIATRAPEGAWNYLGALSLSSEEDVRTAMRVALECK